MQRKKKIRIPVEVIYVEGHAAHSRVVRQKQKMYYCYEQYLVPRVIATNTEEQI